MKEQMMILIRNGEMMTQVERNKAVANAMSEFEDVLDVIYAMLDDDYISMSNFARLLNKILGTDRITAVKLNKLLTKFEVFKKMDKGEYEKLQEQGEMPSRYEITDDILKDYSKKKYGDDYSFYLFNPYLILELFKIEVKYDEVTDEMVNNLIDLFKRKKYADFGTVKRNLETFQLLMKYIF